MYHLFLYLLYQTLKYYILLLPNDYREKAIDLTSIAFYVYIISLYHYL